MFHTLAMFIQLLVAAIAPGKTIEGKVSILELVAYET